jgi:hypothetical protein
MSTRSDGEECKTRARNFNWLWSISDSSSVRDFRLLLRFTLASEGATCIHAARERSVHEFIVHLLLVLLAGYGFARDHPVPIHRRYLEGDLRQILETKRAEGIFLVSLSDDVRGCCGVELWKYNSTVSVNLRAFLTHKKQVTRGTLT